jgi:hypothetical protein
MKKIFVLMTFQLCTCFAFAQTTAAVTEPELPFMNVFVVPDRELVVIQWKNLNTTNREIILSDISGRALQKSTLYAGSTIVFFDTQTLYSGEYEVGVYEGNKWLGKKIRINK